VTLTFCRDLSAADWIVRSEAPWERLVRFGPGGFDSYARLRFLPDPERPGQSENDTLGDGRPDQLPILLDMLSTDTATPDDCFFCVWDGFGQADVTVGDDAEYLDIETAGERPQRTDARPGLAPEPAAARAGPAPPKVVVPHRSYWLFRGPLADGGDWDTARGLPDQCRLHAAEAAFIWPADHAWCVARDVDPHWAGIGGTSSLITRLVADPRLDVVPADPDAEQPVYR
jgi:hypothetical protein